jgi:hypothetical protein
VPAPPQLSADQGGATAIYAAAAAGHDQVVERLLAAKAEVNAATQVLDDARADQARPQPAVRPAVTGMSESEGSLIRSLTERRARSLAWHHE